MCNFKLFIKHKICKTLNEGLKYYVNATKTCTSKLSKPPHFLTTPPYRTIRRYFPLILGEGKIAMNRLQTDPASHNDAVDDAPPSLDARI